MTVPLMETFTFGLGESLAKRLENMSTSHGPGFIDHLLETHVTQLEEDDEDEDMVATGDRHAQSAITEWAPKIGLDSTQKSIEIDVGSQVIVVNLADFYKPRDAAELFASMSMTSGHTGVGGAAAIGNSALAAGVGGDKEMSNGAASGLDLLASTANMYGSGGDGAGVKQPHNFVCAICQMRCASQMALRMHYGSAHGTQLHQCSQCGQSFIRRRDLDKHDCDAAAASNDAAASQKRIPPLVVRPPKGHQPRRLEDTSSEDEDDPKQQLHPRHAPPPASSLMTPAARMQHQPPPPQYHHHHHVAPSSRRMSTPAVTSRGGGGGSRPPGPANRKRLSEAAGKKESYVCRVCQSKFRDPQSVLTHLKQFHPEHAMKAWKKFQDNLKSCRPDASPMAGRHHMSAAPALGGVNSAASASAGGGVMPDTFAVRSVSGAPMKLMLSRSQQAGHHGVLSGECVPASTTTAADAATSGGAGGDVGGGVQQQYAVLPSELPSLQPGQRQPIYHQTQYKVYQPEERPPAPAPSPPPTTAPNTGLTSPGYVTCGVCGGTKYYTFSDQCRLYGSYGCEACRKFISRQSADQPLSCLLGGGQCHIPVLAPRNAADKRCRACWLKKCLLAFNVPEQLHDGLRQALPPSIRQLVPRSAIKPYKECGVCERDSLE